MNFATYIFIPVAIIGALPLTFWLLSKIDGTESRLRRDRTRLIQALRNIDALGHDSSDGDIASEAQRIARDALTALEAS